MTTNKQQVEQLVDKLADKTLSFGCLVKTDEGIEKVIVDMGMHTLKGYGWIKTDYSAMLRYSKNDKEFEILGHPILIGDVLEACSKRNEADCETYAEVIRLWAKLGFTKSLQEIIEASNWKTHERTVVNENGVMSVEILSQQLQDENARALVEFLLSLNL